MLARLLERLNEALDEWLGGMFDVELGHLDGESLQQVAFVDLADTDDLDWCCDTELPVDHGSPSPTSARPSR